jgi:hypothetical protein
MNRIFYGCSSLIALPDLTKNEFFYSTKIYKKNLWDGCLNVLESNYKIWNEFDDYLNEDNAEDDIFDSNIEEFENSSESIE